MLGIQNYFLKEFVILPLNIIVPSTERNKLVMAIIQKSLTEYLRIYGKMELNCEKWMQRLIVLHEQ